MSEDVDVDAYRKNYKMLVDENQELQQYKAEMEILISDLRAKITDLYLTKDREIDLIRAKLAKTNDIAISRRLKIITLKKRLAEGITE